VRPVRTADKTVSGSGTVVSRSAQLHKDSILKARAAASVQTSKFRFHRAIPGIKLSHHAQYRYCDREISTLKKHSEFLTFSSANLPLHFRYRVEFGPAHFHEQSTFSVIESWNNLVDPRDRLLKGRAAIISTLKP
jgi:hypothetical protein